MTDLALAADEEARRRAADPQRSVILQAPAGSGKTTVLIERLLVLLAQAQEPEEILAITFTRKAAAEMAQRVAQALQGSGPTAAAVRERSQQRGWQLLENPNRLRIQTLDALNRALALQMPLAAGGSGSLSVLAQPETAYQVAARRTLLDAQADPRRQGDLEQLFARMENEFGRCETLLADMLKRRTHWLPHLAGDAAAQLSARVRRSLESVVAARLQQAADLLAAPLLQEGVAIAAAAAAHRGAPPVAPFAPIPTLAQCQALCEVALTQKGQWRKTLNVNGGFPPHDPLLKRRGLDWIAQLAAHPGALELLNELILLPDPEPSRAEIEQLGGLARLLELAAAELSVVFQELGRVDYAAVARAAQDALGSFEDPTDLALRLDNRLRHILVDEFQDTSLEQTRLLELLTAGWQPGDGRTLFLVGDPMQSIYGFREAEVGMFLAARRVGIGSVTLEPLLLNRNFRSTPQLVEWHNAVFSRCFAPADDPRSGAVAYAPSCAARSAAHGSGVQLHRVAPGDLLAEASAITRLITQLRAREPRSSIAILVSARTHAAPLVAALEAAHIAVAGVELVPLAELSIVRDLTALTCSLDHLGDRSAWLALLRAPWCGLSLRELTELLGADRQVSVWERVCDPLAVSALAAPAQARVRRVRGALEPWFDAQRAHSGAREDLARAVQAAWLRLGGPAACAQDADLQHAQAFFSALGQWSTEPDWSGPQDLPQRLTQLFAEHAGQGAQAVQIMTIHRAKGLEFDHVILPGLGRPRGSNQRPLLQWLDLPRADRGTDLLMAPLQPAAASAPTALGRYLSHLHAERTRHESTRLLYVAATRARSTLHLFGELRAADSGKSEPAPRSGTLLERLWPALREQFPPHPETAQEAAPPAAAARAAPPRERLTATWQVPPEPAPPPVSGLRVGAPAASAATAGPADQAEQALCEALRRLLRTRPVPDAAAALRRLLGAALSGAALAQAMAGLERCMADPRLQWILSSHAQCVSARAPLRLTGLYAGELISIAADLSFTDAAGVSWLIDFAPWPAEPLEQAFALRLAQYAQLAGALDGRARVRAGIYLPGRAQFWTAAED